MRLCEIYHNQSGATAVELGLTAPIFFAVIFGITEGGLLLWTQVGLQHGTEVAARYASTTGKPPATPCGSASAVRTYAANHSFGLNPSPSNFTVSTPACGCQVSASFSFPFAAFFPTRSLALSALACYPKKT